MADDLKQTGRADDPRNNIEMVRDVRQHLSR